MPNPVSIIISPYCSILLQVLLFHGIKTTGWSLFFPLSKRHNNQARTRNIHSARHLKMSSCMLPPTSSSLKDFVQHYKSSLNDGGCANKVVNLFLGNEAADADSIFSAFCYGYHSWLKANQNQIHNPSSVHSSTWRKEVFIPLTFVKAADLSLRAELQIILNKVDLNTRDLLLAEQFLSSTSINSSKIAEADKVCITLLDHNALSAQFESSILGIMNREKVEVVEIIDHHCDEQAHIHIQGRKRRIAFESEPSLKALTGSCCTLVHEAIVEDGGVITRDMAVPLLGVILLDTLNMDPAAHKGTDRDQIVLNEIKGTLNMDSSKINTFFDELSNAKTDPKLWESLTVCESLRFDYKKFPAVNRCSGNTISIGFSSVLLPIDRFCEKQRLKEEILDYMNNCGIDCLVIMFFFIHKQSNQPTRELIVVERASTARLSAHLVNHVGSLELTPHTRFPSIDFNSVGCVVSAFNQGNIKFSRKQVAPIVVEYFEKNIDH